MISKYSEDQIKQRASIAEVVGDYVKLKKSGADYEACCPFHDEKTPSFKVHTAKQIFKCFGCGTSGDSVAFVVKHQQKTYPEALEILAKRYNIAIEYDTPQPKREYKRPQPPKFALSTNALSYLSSRKISPEICQQFKVSTTTERMPKAKSEVECICFNYYRNDELINIKYRAKDKDFKLAKDAELIFYNLDSLKDAEYAIIVEGEVDALSVAEYYKTKPNRAKTAILSVPNGANVQGAMKLEYLDNCYAEFKHIKQIILFTDNDEAGTRLRDELGRRLGLDRCFKVVDYHGCKDANKILVDFGVDALEKSIITAKEFPIEGLVDVSILESDAHNFYINGYPNGFKSGIPNLDDLISFMLGQFTMITAPPGAGKSEFTDYIATELTRNHSWEWGVCSFENQPASLHVTKLMEKHAGKSFDFRYNDSDRIGKHEFDDSLNFVLNHFNFININIVEVTIDGLLEKFSELVLRKGIRGVILDPWNYIEHKYKAGQTETNYVSEALTKISAFCKRHQVHMLIIAHPRKLQKTNGKYELVTLNDIAGSGNFWAKTDNGISINRDGELVQVYVQKIRFSWLGKIGMCEFTFDKVRRKYVPIGEPDPFMNKIPDNPHAGIKQAIKFQDTPF